ncbi:hypothetical protein RIF29_41011 [Crotalaria pallida]|uniref:Uncharacterized protein n=1 Tax=Crotalaria pallida TaxID=3830 RepID=A0AAN9HR72_CROPI
MVNYQHFVLEKKKIKICEVVCCCIELAINCIPLIFLLKGSLEYICISHLSAGVTNKHTPQSQNPTASASLSFSDS